MSALWPYGLPWSPGSGCVCLGGVRLSPGLPTRGVKEGDLLPEVLQSLSPSSCGGRAPSRPWWNS